MLMVGSIQKGLSPLHNLNLKQTAIRIASKPPFHLPLACRTPRLRAIFRLLRVPFEKHENSVSAVTACGGSPLPAVAHRLCVPIHPAQKLFVPLCVKNTRFIPYCHYATPVPPRAPLPAPRGALPLPCVIRRSRRGRARWSIAGPPGSRRRGARLDIPQLCRAAWRCTPLPGR